MNPVKLAKLEKKLNDMYQDFTGEVRGMTLIQVKDLVSKLSLEIQTVLNARDNDSELIEVREQVKEMNAPYRESLKKIKDKLLYVVSILEEKNIPAGR